MSLKVSYTYICDWCGANEGPDQYAVALGGALPHPQIMYPMGNATSLCHPCALVADRGAREALTRERPK